MEALDKLLGNRSQDQGLEVGCKTAEVQVDLEEECRTTAAQVVLEAEATALEGECRMGDHLAPLEIRRRVVHLGALSPCQEDLLGVVRVDLLEGAREDLLLEVVLVREPHGQLAERADGAAESRMPELMCSSASFSAVLECCQFCPDLYASGMHMRLYWTLF
jgi:hypothetical protein